MIVLGIDPGVTGGLAWLDAEGQVMAEDIPVVGGEVNVDELARMVREHAPTYAVIERASAYPKQGVASVFKFGVAYGCLRTVLSVCGMSYHIVTPGTWKRYFHLPADKEMARKLAIQYWPGAGCFEHKKDHGRAEAALIALYGVRQGWYVR